MNKNNSQPQEITLTRTIRAPAARGYAAFTSAEAWCEWCCEKADIDARVGGQLHIYTEGYHAYGAFTNLEENKAVAFTWDGDHEPPTQIHVSLHDQGGSTVMTFKVIGLGPEHSWADFSELLQRVWGHALDSLKILLEEKPDQVLLSRIICPSLKSILLSHRHLY